MTDPGTDVVLSQSATAETFELYAPLLQHVAVSHRVVAARRNINSKGTGRGPVGEILAWTRGSDD